MTVCTMDRACGQRVPYLVSSGANLYGLCLSGRMLLRFHLAEILILLRAGLNLITCSIYATSIQPFQTFLFVSTRSAHQPLPVTGLAHTPYVPMSPALKVPPASTPTRSLRCQSEVIVILPSASYLTQEEIQRDSCCHRIEYQDSLLILHSKSPYDNQRECFSE